MAHKSYCKDRENLIPLNKTTEEQRKTLPRVLINNKGIVIKELTAQEIELTLGGI